MGDHYLVEVRGLVYLSDPESYGGGSWQGHPMPDRWKGRDQKKSNPLTLQVGGWALD